MLIDRWTQYLEMGYPDYVELAWDGSLASSR